MAIAFFRRRVRRIRVDRYIVQVFNPRTRRWIKIDTRLNRILGQKNGKPYKKIRKYRVK